MELEDRFFRCLKGTGRGLTYGRLVRRYAEITRLTERTAKTHLRSLVGGITARRVKAVARYNGPEGMLYGSPEDALFVQAKEDAEKPLVERPAAIVHLGGVFQDSPVRSEWTHCPVTNRIVKSTIITMGVADFMQCPICSWTHFLGVSPKMKDRRLYAWQVDPLANPDEYADALSVLYLGDPKTNLLQPTRIERVRKGGHRVGFWFRSSWDEDPMEKLAKVILESKKTRKTRFRTLRNRAKEQQGRARASKVP